jgi:hypothetical protein
LLSEQAYLGGELICTIAQAQTVGLPLAATIGAAKGLFVRWLIEHPATTADKPAMANHRTGLYQWLLINMPFLSKAGASILHPRHNCYVEPMLMRSRVMAREPKR